MRLCSAFTAAALLCSQSAYAFNPTTLNFDAQAQAYNAQYQYSLPLHLTTTAQPTDSQPTVNLDQPPYHFTAQQKDWDYLLGQTGVIFGFSVLTVGLMTLLPESVTKWDEEDRDISRLGSKWWSNVSDGPVWDEDEHYLNYVMHPYFGGVYYIAARHAGFNEFESFFYSFVMSTFFWEYGVEAFAEVPSIQDIIVTPLFGALAGELMYNKEQQILAKGEVMGSETLADVSLFLLNPVGHIHYWLTDWWNVDTKLRITQDRWFGYHQAAQFADQSNAGYSDNFVGLQFEVKF